MEPQEGLRCLGAWCSGVCVEVLGQLSGCSLLPSERKVAHHLSGPFCPASIGCWTLGLMSSLCVLFQLALGLRSLFSASFAPELSCCFLTVWSLALCHTWMLMWCPPLPALVQHYRCWFMSLPRGYRTSHSFWMTLKTRGLRGSSTQAFSLLIPVLYPGPLFCWVCSRLGAGEHLVRCLWTGSGGEDLFTCPPPWELQPREVGQDLFHGLLRLPLPVFFLLYTRGWKGGLVYFSNPVLLSISLSLLSNTKIQCQSKKSY